MKREFNLTIYKPCKEEFSEFQPTQVGGFCNSCQKEVIDFTKMNEDEILLYFKNRPKNTCGRFSEPQLKTYSEYLPSKRRLNVNLLGAGLFSFSLLSLLSINGQAQHIEQSPTTHISQKESNKKQNTNPRKDNDEHIVEGIVVEDNTPFPGVNILLKGSTTGTVTDIDGRFKFPQTLKTGDILIFSLIGYDSKTFLVTENAPYKLDIKIEFNSCDLVWLGEVSIEEVYTSKPSLWQKFKGIFR